MSVWDFYWTSRNYCELIQFLRTTATSGGKEANSTRSIRNSRIEESILSLEDVPSEMRKRNEAEIFEMTSRAYWSAHQEKLTSRTGGTGRISGGGRFRGWLRAVFGCIWTSTGNLAVCCSVLGGRGIRDRRPENTITAGGSYARTVEQSVHSETWRMQLDGRATFIKRL